MSAPAASKEMDQKLQTVQPETQKLGILEEDDEFEEFPVENWEDGQAANKIELAEAWEQDWDDDNIEDEFSNQLRAEIAKLKQQ